MIMKLGRYGACGRAAVRAAGRSEILAGPDA